ncbi:MAG: hypothetical protein ACR2L2_07435 [Acidobacteriota bacterium]
MISDGTLKMAREALSRVLTTPELYLALLGIPFNFMWEVLQKPLFVVVAGMTQWEGTIMCLNFAVRDGLMLVAIYWLVSLYARSRGWIQSPTGLQVLAYIGLGVLLTVVLENYHLQRGDWAYGSGMPTLPVIGVGLAPAAQWVFVPAFVLFLTRALVIGAGSLNSTCYKRTEGSNE